MKKIFNSRFFSIVIILIAVSAILSSCMGTASTTVSKTVKNYNGAENVLKQEELDAVATKIYNNAEARDAFLAAYRGYDVIDGKDTDFSVNKGVNYEYVQKVITKYAGIIFAEDVVEEENPDATTPDGENPDATTPEETPEETPDATTPETTPEVVYPEFAPADADLILIAIQDTVDLSTKRDLMGNIRYYIGSFLGFITRTVGFGNYLIAICIFAIIIEICMIPLSIKQQKNSIKQAMLRPKEMAIRNRYKGRDDRATQQKVAMEIQELYQRENFNPMGGCLPLLIQLPIIMVLYRIVVDPLQNVLGCSANLTQALGTYATTSQAAGGLGMTLKSSNGTIELLSKIRDIDFSGLKDFLLFQNSNEIFENFAQVANKIPSFKIAGIDFGYTPSFNDNYLLLVVPVLTFVTYFFSMKISRKFTYQPTQNENAPGAGCSTKMMEWYMPLMSTFFCFLVPGAVGIYWVFKSVISTFKQYIMSKVMPLPVFTEEDFKAAERELGTKKPQRKRKGESSESNLDPNRERPRSLHHIDDDEEDYISFVK